MSEGNEIMPDGLFLECADLTLGLQLCACWSVNKSLLSHMKH